MSPAPAGRLRFWPSFGRHGAAYLVGEAAGKGLVYLFFLWLATRMGIEGFGYVNVFIAWSSLMAVVVSLGIPDAVLRFHFGDEDPRHVAGMVVAVPLAAGAVLLALAWLARAPLAALLNLPPGLLLLAVATGPVAALRQGLLVHLRARRRSRQHLAVRLAEPLLLIVAVAVAAAAGGGALPAESVAAAWAASLAVLAAVAVAYFARRPGLRWSGRAVRPLLAFSLPLVVHALAMTGLASFDQVVIQQVLGAEATGSYAFAYRFGMAMSLIAFGVSAAWGPLAFERLRAGDAARLAPLAVLAARLSLAAAIALAWLLPPVAAVVGGAEYADSLPLVPLVVYAYVWTGLYGLAVVFPIYRGRTGALAAVSGTAFVANAVLNYLTVPQYGPLAAAISTIACYLLLFLLTRRLFGDGDPALPWRRLALEAAAAAPLFAAAAWLYR